MGIREIIDNLTSKFNISSYVKNKESNNITNSYALGNNFGVENIGGDKITQFNTFNIVVNDGDINEDINSVDLENDIKRIKKIPNSSFSLNAIEEYEKLLLLYYPKNISNEDYIKILLNICYVYINRNELHKADEFISKLDDTCHELNKDIIKVKGIIAFNNGEHRRALDFMNRITWSINDKFEYVLYQALRCINKVITYEEFKDTIIIDDELRVDLVGDSDENIYNIILITARNEKQYDDMLLYAYKAFRNTDDIYSKLQYAHRLYDYAIKDSTDGDRVFHDKINYKYLVDSKLLCEEILELAESTKDIKLYKDCLLLYVNILSLLGKINDAIENLKNIKFIENNEELINFEYRLKYLYNKDNNTNNKLSEEDLFIKEIFDLLDSKKYSEIISKIESQCWDKYNEDIKIHCILLECYIEKKEYSMFIKHIRKLEYNKIESNLLIKVKARYHIEKADYEQAESYLKESIGKYRDPDTYCWLLKLYYEQEEIEKYEELMERILNEDKFILEVEYVRIYASYFKFLFKQNLYYKALEILNNNCDKNKFGEQNYVNASINIFSHLGRYYDSAKASEKLYRINNDYEVLFNAANEYFRCNELDKSLDILKCLEQKKVNFLEKVYVMISNVNVLKNELHIAYEYAEKAKELVIDIPKSEVHNFFVGRSLRCNKVNNGVIHINEFREAYPKVDNWIKCFKAIETDEEGNEGLSSEIIEFLKTQSEGFENLLQLLRNGEVGISIVCKCRQHTINELIRWKDIYRIKININGGNTSEMLNEMNNITEIIVVDVFILYILADINQLEFLRNFREIRICNSTIEYLNYLLLKEEDSNVRKILLYIENEINIRIVYINHYSKNNFEAEVRNIFDDFILDSVLYAKENAYSYCYGEVFVKKLCNTVGANGVSLISLIRSLNQDKSYVVINKLMNQNYEFINFTYKDMYYIAKDSRFSNYNDLENFFKISRQGDISSFIIQYIIFIYAIYYLNKDSFDIYFKLYLRSMSSLYKKSYYYLYISNTLANEVYGNKKSIDKLNYLINKEEYIRANTMQLEATNAIKEVFNLFESDDEIKYYTDLAVDITDKEVLNDTFTSKYIKEMNYKETIIEMIKEL